MKNVYVIAFLFFLGSCANTSKVWSAGCAASFGADWIIVQQSMVDGHVYNCWLLRGVSLTNEANSDGVWWKDDGGHLVHIAGQYARIQVTGSQFKAAGKIVGIDSDLCTGGSYPHKD